MEAKLNDDEPSKHYIGAGHCRTFQRRVLSTQSQMDTTLFFLSLGLSTGFVFVFLKRTRGVKSDVSSLRGPDSRSWLYGEYNPCS